MSSEETTTGNSLPAGQAIPAGKASASAAMEQPASRPLAGILAMGGAGLLAGTIGWLILDQTFPYFRVSDEMLQRIPMSFPPAELLAEFFAEKRVVDVKNATAAGLLLGTLAAAAFAVVQGAVRGYHRSYLPMAICVVCGGVAGAAAGLASQVWMQHLLSTTEPMTAAVVLQAVFWAITGAGAGAGVGLFSGSVSRGGNLVGQGLLAGGLFGLVYAVTAAFAFPGDHAELLVPASLANRAAWAVAGTTLIGLLLGAASDRRRNRPQGS